MPLNKHLKQRPHVCRIIISRNRILSYLLGNIVLHHDLVIVTRWDT